MASREEVERVKRLVVGKYGREPWFKGAGIGVGVAGEYVQVLVSGKVPKSFPNYSIINNILVVQVQTGPIQAR